jgi:hypothetical protein
LVTCQQVVPKIWIQTSLGMSGMSKQCIGAIGERPYLTTKIITLSEFFNFVHQVSRL